MKNWCKILASILGLYIFILSPLLAFHIGSHISSDVKKVERQYDINHITEDSHCYICNFYLNQDLYYEDIAIINLLKNIIYDNSSYLKLSLQTTTLIELYLRGPPFS